MDEAIDAYLFCYVAGWDNPREAYKWYLFDIYSPQDALRLYKAGWDMFEVTDWLKSHYERSSEVGETWLDNPAEARAWKEAGWESAEEAYEWYKAGWRDPKDAFKWEKSGEWNPDNPEELKIAYRIYRTLNINDPVEAKKIAQRIPIATKRNRPKRP